MPSEPTFRFSKSCYFISQRTSVISSLNVSPIGLVGLRNALSSESTITLVRRVGHVFVYVRTVKLILQCLFNNIADKPLRFCGAHV